MARLSRIVVVNTPHHVTQRGNARQFILASDAERMVYLELLQQYIEFHRLSLLGYCLMSNHVHLVVVPREVDALALTMKQTHGRYAAYWNSLHSSSGHVWQGRFYSCPLDDQHLWIALRYTELNPVRAGLVAAVESWPWSSAGAHSGSVQPPPFLELDMWSARWTISGWREYLAAGETAAELKAIRRSTHTGRPIGSPQFMQSLEDATRRRLTPQKGGRPLLANDGLAQKDLPFAN